MNWKEIVQKPNYPGGEAIEEMSNIDFTSRTMRKPDTIVYFSVLLSMQREY